jgi:hypothetical protein
MHLDEQDPSNARNNTGRISLSYRRTDRIGSEGPHLDINVDEDDDNIIYISVALH